MRAINNIQGFFLGNNVLFNEFCWSDEAQSYLQAIVLECTGRLRDWPLMTSQNFISQWKYFINETSTFAEAKTCLSNHKRHLSNYLDHLLNTWVWGSHYFLILTLREQMHTVCSLQYYHRLSKQLWNFIVFFISHYLKWY